MNKSSDITPNEKGSSSQTNSHVIKSSPNPPRKRHGSHPPPHSCKKPRKLESQISTSNKFRGKIHYYTTANNGIDSCFLVIAFVTKHYADKQQYYMRELLDGSNGMNELNEFIKALPDPNEQHIFCYETTNIKNFIAGNEDSFKDNLRNQNFLCFVANLTFCQQGLHKIRTPTQWADKFGKILKKFFTKMYETNRRNYGCPDFELAEHKELQPHLSRIFRREDLWKVLHLLWDVDEDDIFEEVLEHEESLAMIFGTTNRSFQRNKAELNELRNDYKYK